MNKLSEGMTKTMIALTFIVLFIDVGWLIFFLFFYFDFLKCMAICFSIFACVHLNRALQGEK